MVIPSARSLLAAWLMLQVGCATLPMTAGTIAGKYELQGSAYAGESIILRDDSTFEHIEFSDNLVDERGIAVGVFCANLIMAAAEGDAPCWATASTSS